MMKSSSLFQNSRNLSIKDGNFEHTKYRTTREQKSVFLGPIYGYTHTPSLGEGPYFQVTGESDHRAGQHSGVYQPELDVPLIESPIHSGIVHEPEPARYPAKRAYTLPSRLRHHLPVVPIPTMKKKSETHLDICNRTVGRGPPLGRPAQTKRPTEVQAHRASFTKCHSGPFCIPCSNNSFCPTRPLSMPVESNIIRTIPHDACNSSRTNLPAFPAQMASDIPPELVTPRSLTDTNGTFDPFSVANYIYPDPLSSSSPNPHVEYDHTIPQAIERGLSREFDTMHHGVALQTLVASPEDVNFRPGFRPQPDRGLSMGPLHYHSASTRYTSHDTLSPALQSPVIHLENMRPTGELIPVNLPHEEPSRALDGLSSKLKERAAIEITLTALIATVTWGVVCSDRMENHLQVCDTLGTLRPMVLLLQLGSALTTGAILFAPRDAISSLCLRLIWTVFFGLGLCCVVVQVLLYAWTMGDLLTRILTALVAVLCSLPGFYFIILKWHPGPASEGRAVEA